MNELKNKKTMIALILLTMLVIVGASLAYFTSNAFFENQFKTGIYKTVSTETFESPDNWLPGTETPKTLTVKNEGTVPVIVRISYEEEWKNAEGESIPLEEDDIRAAIINFDNEGDWTKKGKYYYYQDELAPGETTSSFMKSVTFNKDITGKIVCTPVGDGKTQNCASNDNGYDGATYILTITVETLQADAVNEVWQAVFDTGVTVNGKIIALAGGDKVKKLAMSNSLPEDFTPSDSNTVSANDSNAKIYIWFDEPSGILYFCSESSKIYLNEDANRMFRNLTELTNLEALSEFDVSKTTSLFGIFLGCKKLENLTSLENWDVSNVTDFGALFYNCYKLTNINALANWDLSNAENLYCLFYQNAISDISALENWDVSNVTNMAYVFSKCKNISNIMPLKEWDVSNAINMYGLFYNCSITDLTPIKNWDTGNVTDMSCLFGYNTTLTDLTPIKDWNVSKVTTMFEMFDGCTSLTNTSPINDWEINEVTDFTSMFRNAPSHPEFTKRSGTWENGTFTTA